MAMAPCLLVALAVAGARSERRSVAKVIALEAEHLNLLPPSTNASGGNGPVWPPPALDGDQHLFSWRVAFLENAATASGARAAIPLRNVTQVAATLTLMPTAPGHPTIVCSPEDPSSLKVLCGSAAAWSTSPTRYTATIVVSLTAGSDADVITANATSVGTFIRGPLRGSGWGGAQWIGLDDANSMALQFRTVTELMPLGFAQDSDVVEAYLLVSGLGGHRTSINARAVDPTSVRASVTEWSNRTFYFVDDVTADVKQAAAANGRLVVAVEVYKHWYGLQNAFYPRAYGPRSLKAVLFVRHANGSFFYAAPTCAGNDNHCGWRHGAGSTTHEDLHTGQIGDGRLATPGWEDLEFDASGPGWAVPAAVNGPPGELRPVSMQVSRVLEVARPVSVARTGPDPNSHPGTTFRFTLEHEVAGFCSILLPPGTPAGTVATVRHGEAVNMGTGHLVDVECTGPLNHTTHGFHCVRMAYTARGNADGLSAHDRAWRKLAIQATPKALHRTDVQLDSDEIEAFTPAFQYSAFKYIQVTYSSNSSAHNNTLQLAGPGSVVCFRIGAAFDWIGDVAVGAPTAPTRSVNSTTAAERFNTVVAATRSTAISNYLADYPTDCPHREKRGWTGDSLAAHHAVASFFDMRAAWTKWVDDMLFMQSLLGHGNMGTIAPCIFLPLCYNDPRKPNQIPPAVVNTDVAWGSALPLLAAFTAGLTDDSRLASRAAGGATAFVDLLLRFANNASTKFPGLLNATQWPGTHLGDWVPAVGHSATSTLLNSHHLILDLDAATELLRRAGNDSQFIALREQQAATARASFAGAFLHNVTVPGSAVSTCGVEPEKVQVELTCGGSATISEVKFASYGRAPEGSCATGFRPNKQCALDVHGPVAAACIGRTSCTVECSPKVPHLRMCAGVNVTDPCLGSKKQLAVSVACSSPPVAPITIPSYHDPFPRPGKPVVQLQTEAVSGLAAMDAAPDSLIDPSVRAILGNSLAALVRNRNASNPQLATVTGGIIDTSYLAPELINHGHPDVAFDLLAADGSPSFYNMARYSGTLWENWINANGCDTPAGCEKPVSVVEETGAGVGSLNHIMYGGSVGAAVFGIGGIKPNPSGPPSLAPIPWLPDAPRGAVVWQSRAGILSAAWAAATSGLDKAWKLWVNVTIPAASGGANVKLMFPQLTVPGTSCVWECGPHNESFTSTWETFDNARAGYRRLQAKVPPVGTATAPTASELVDRCTPIWHAGTPSKIGAAGLGGIEWESAKPGRTMFPALTLTATSGTFSLYAQKC